MQEIDTEANKFYCVCVCVAVIASIVESWNMFQSQNIHVVTCHTAGTLETVSWRGTGWGIYVGPSKVLVITFQAKPLGKQNYPYQVDCDSSINAGDEAVILSWICVWWEASHRLSMCSTLSFPQPWQCVLPLSFIIRCIENTVVLFVCLVFSRQSFSLETWP